MSKPVLVLLAAVVAIGVLVAGCGGSSDNSSTDSTASLTKAEFLKKGNAICAKGNEKIEEGFEKFVKENHINPNKEPTEDQLKALADEVLVPTVGGQLEELRALGMPKGDEEAADELLTEAEQVLEKVEGDPSLLGGDNADPFEEVNENASDYGLTACGEE